MAITTMMIPAFLRNDIIFSIILSFELRYAEFRSIELIAYANNLSLTFNSRSELMNIWSGDRRRKFVAD